MLYAVGPIAKPVVVYPHSVCVNVAPKLNLVAVPPSSIRDGLYKV